METKKRPLAMRCTQEQFDSIKDRIPCEKIDIQSFNKYPYLSYYDFKNYVSNTNLVNIKEVHETFNADIFLEAFGGEVEKIWKHTEIQYRMYNGRWTDCNNDEVEYRVKPSFNSADYNKEIEALQEKAKLNGMKAVVTFEKL